MVVSILMFTQNVSLLPCSDQASRASLLAMRGVVALFVRMMAFHRDRPILDLSVIPFVVKL